MGFRDRRSHISDGLVDQRMRGESVGVFTLAAMTGHYAQPDYHREGAGQEQHEPSVSVHYPCVLPAARPSSIALAYPEPAVYVETWGAADSLVRWTARTCPYVRTATSRTSGGSFLRSAKEIIELAMRDRYDLVVMATHGRSGLQETLQGSVTAEVIRSGVSPVLVIRPKNGREGASTSARPAWQC